MKILKYLLFIAHFTAFECVGQTSFEKVVSYQLSNQFQADSIVEVKTKKGKFKNLYLYQNEKIIYTIKALKLFGKTRIWTLDSVGVMQGLHLTFFKQKRFVDYPMLNRQITYKNSVTEGKLNCLNEKGFLLCDKNFANGKIHGEAIFFYGKNNVDTMEVAHFNMGKLHGQRVYYDYYGKKQSISNYINGVPEGSGLRFYTDENSSLVTDSLFYVSGLKHGVQTYFFYRESKLENVQREYFFKGNSVSREIFNKKIKIEIEKGTTWANSNVLH